MDKNKIERYHTCKALIFIPEYYWVKQKHTHRI